MDTAERSPKSELRLEVRNWSKQDPDPQRRLLSLLRRTEGASFRNKVTQDQINRLSRGRGLAKGREDDKVHAEEEHVVR